VAPGLVWFGNNGPGGAGGTSGGGAMSEGSGGGAGAPGGGGGIPSRSNSGRGAIDLHTLGDRADFHAPGGFGGPAIDKSGQAQYVIPRNTPTGLVAVTEALTNMNDTPACIDTDHIPPPNNVVCRDPFSSTGNWQAKSYSPNAAPNVPTAG
jgi:hypothetical protein